MIYILFVVVHTEVHAFVKMHQIAHFKSMHSYNSNTMYINDKMKNKQKEREQKQTVIFKDTGMSMYLENSTLFALLRRATVAMIMPNFLE